jgi:hypothetical protein
MISTDIITRIRRTFGDEASVQITDDDIIRWINDGQREIAQAASCLETKLTGPYLPGNPLEIPSNSLALSAVWWTDSEGKPVVLKHINFEEAQNSFDLTEEADTPVVYWTYGKTIYLYPIPTAARVISLFYIREPQVVTSINTTLEIPLQYHNRLLEYVLKQAYELDENMEAAALKGQEMSNALTQQADTEAWSRRAVYPSISVAPEDRY